MQLKKEEIASILSKAVSDSLGQAAPAAGTTPDTRIASVETAIQSLTKQIQTLADLAATGFQKPKTVEELTAEMQKSIETNLTAVINKALGKEDDKVAVPGTKAEFQKMIEDTIMGILEKTAKETGKPKGKGKDSAADLEKAISDDDVQEITDQLLDDAGVEKTDKAGNPLSKEARTKRFNLDKALGDMLSAKHPSNKDADNDEDDNE